MLVFGGLGIVSGVFPAFSAGTLATFLLVATPIMHDFWRVPEGVQQEQEMIHFLKNATMLGAVLVLLASTSIPWPYAL